MGQNELTSILMIFKGTPINIIVLQQTICTRHLVSSRKNCKQNLAPSRLTVAFWRFCFFPYFFCKNKRFSHRKFKCPFKKSPLEWPQRTTMAASWVLDPGFGNANKSCFSRFPMEKGLGQLEIWIQNVKICLKRSRKITHNLSQELNSCFFSRNVSENLRKN